MPPKPAAFTYLSHRIHRIAISDRMASERGEIMHGFLDALRVQRWDDHRYYHHSTVNQLLHLVSALSFVFAYAMLFKDPAVAVLVAWLIGMTSRQIGHFFFEPRDYDVVNQATHEHKEEIKVGYNLQRKVVLMSIWALSPIALYLDPTLPAGSRRTPTRPNSFATRRRQPAVGVGGCCSAPCICSSSRMGRVGRSGLPKSSPTRFTTSCSTTRRRSTAARRDARSGSRE
jgi:hypothetical protein